MVFDNKVENQNIKVNVFPESAGKGVGKGIEAAGKGVEAVSKGFANVPWSLGEWMRTRSLQKNISKTIDLLNNKTFTKLIITCDKIEVEDEPKTLVGTIQLQEEKNLKLLVKNIVEEIAYREINNEQIPSKLEDTDNLLAIEKAASETSDEDLQKMWAKLFIEEAINKNSINKRVINLLKLLDKESIEILQNEIFQFCDDEEGWFFDNNNISARTLAIDLGILEDYNIQSIPINNKNKNFNNIPYVCFTIGKNMIIGHPGYAFVEKYHLTDIGLKIKKISKIKYDDKNIQNTINCIKKGNCFRLFNEKFKCLPNIKIKDSFVIIEGNNINSKVIYPENKYENMLDYVKQASDYISYKEQTNDK